MEDTPALNSSLSALPDIQHDLAKAPDINCYNTHMNPRSLTGLFLAFANQLKYRSLFLVVISLLVVDLLVPDFIPMIDEIILALLAIILANWKKERAQGKEQGNLIEGEIINEDK